MTVRKLSVKAVGVFVTLGVLLSISFVWTDMVPVRAAEESGQVVVADEADLLTGEEEEQLAEIMRAGADFGNMVFYTTNYNPCSNTDRLAETAYTTLFGEREDGVIFVINMDDREIYISGYGNCQYTLPDSYCYTITDNVYRYASGAEYYECAAEAFEQIHAVMVGKDIPKPMKYICNVLLAVAAALILNFLLVMSFSRKNKPSRNEVKRNITYQCNIYNPRVAFTHEKRVYNPPSSSSSGGGRNGGGGGHSSGGHSGGGHRF